MVGAKEEKKVKGIAFESWKPEYVRDGDKAKGLLKNLVTMNRPVCCRGNALYWLVYDELGIRAEQMTKDNLRAELDEANYYLERHSEQVYENGEPAKDKEGNPIKKWEKVVARIPSPVIDRAFGLYDKGLYELQGVMSHPIINREGKYVLCNGLYWEDRQIKGTIVKKPILRIDDGYDPVTQKFFAIPERVMRGLKNIQNIVPTVADVKAAVEFIDYFFCDFKFASKSARASLIAFLLTMLIHELIKEYIPALEVRGAMPHVGKSLLVKMSLLATTGQIPTAFTPNFKNVEEFEKEYFSILLQGQNYIFLDNVKGKVESPLLEMVLKTGLAKKRILGVSATATVNAKIPHVMTANNPKMSEDMKNRIYLLDIERPPENTQFVHKYPEEYALEEGPPLLKALFCLYNNWDMNYERQPFTAKRMEGFIPWSETIGGILAAAEIDGFLEDTLKQIKEVDPKYEQGASMAQPWYGERGAEWMLIKDVIPYGIEAGYISDKDVEAKNVQKLRMFLDSLRQVPLPGGYRFEKDTDRTRRSLWRVVKDGGE